MKNGEIKMAKITNRKLSIKHDHEKKLAHVKVTCTVNFNSIELCQMKLCPKARLFRLKCELWSYDVTLPEIMFGEGNRSLYTFSNVFYFPDPTPTSSEDRTFEVTLGEGVLDEDGWEGGYVDEILGKLYLFNLYTTKMVVGNTNIVSHSFE